MTTPHSQSGSTATDAFPETRRGDAARRRLDSGLKRFSVPLLRVSLGVIFVWFGGLKVVGATPVKELVAGTVPWVNPDLFVPALGAFEVLIGVGLIIGYQLGWVVAAMVAHLGGTFLTVVMQPGAVFQHGNPLMLTMEGEFVTKNIVLITAGLVLATWPRGLAVEEPSAVAPPR
jgi:uncharacterized membrane protein YkgB